MVNQMSAIEEIHALCLWIRSKGLGGSEPWEDPSPTSWAGHGLSIYNLLARRAQELPPAVIIACRRLARFLETYGEGDELGDSMTAMYGNPKDIEINNEIALCLEAIEEEYKPSKQSASEEEFNFILPQNILPPDVTEMVNLVYEEALRDYSGGCYISTIAMCGKIVETILSSLYTAVTGKDADVEQLGWDAISNRLKKERGYVFKGAKEQLEIIKMHRNKAVHGSIVIPTIDEARGVLSFTRDVLTKTASKKD